MRCFSAATEIPTIAIEMISVAETLKHRNKDIEFPLKNVNRTRESPGRLILLQGSKKSINTIDAMPFLLFPLKEQHQVPPTVVLNDTR